MLEILSIKLSDSETPVHGSMMVSVELYMDNYPNSINSHNKTLTICIVCESDLYFVFLFLV